MSMQYDPSILTIWQKLCSIYAARRLVLLQPEEILPSLLNLSNDQITWHQRHSTSWKEATEIMRPQSTSMLQALGQISRNNLELNKRRLSVFTTLFLFTTSFLMFFIALVMGLLSLSDIESLPLEVLLPWLGLSGVMSLMFLCAHARTWNTMRQARELSSCIDVTLALRQAADNSDHA